MDSGRNHGTTSTTVQNLDIQVGRFRIILERAGGAVSLGRPAVVEIEREGAALKASLLEWSGREESDRGWRPECPIEAFM
jgi:hypothetical protein